MLEVFGELAIGSATQQGSSLSVWSENGRLLFARAGKLVGFTSDTVTVRVGSNDVTYDDRGTLKFARPLSSGSRLPLRS